MSAQPLSLTVSLMNDKLLFEAALRDNAPVRVDYIPPLGDGQGYMPLELFLMSLASCAGSTVVSLLRKMRKTVVSFSVEARGWRREEHPTVFERVELHFAFVSPDAAEADVQRSIELTEEKYCPVWAMVRGNVDVRCTYKITAQ